MPGRTRVPNKGSVPDRTAKERRKGLTEEQIRELELAGGVEGGMPAGSAGGPGANELTEKHQRAQSPSDRH